jgi:hypothetical protein
MVHSNSTNGEIQRSLSDNIDHDDAKPPSSFIPSPRVLPRQLTPFERLQLRVRFKVGARLFRKSYEGHVIRLSRHTLVKMRTEIDPTEAMTMEFVAANTTIPVPRVFKVVDWLGRTVIFMEFIDARMLITTWLKMPSNERMDIMLQSKGYLAQLRNLKPPHPGRVEAVDGTGCFDVREMSDRFGPFATVAEFHQYHGYSSIRNSPNWTKYQPHFEKCDGRSYRTVFSHCDIGPHNILVKEGRIVAIIDWEFAGWYPEYWEYTRMFFGSTGFTGWWETWDQVMDRYPDELAIERDLAREYPRLGL